LESGRLITRLDCNFSASFFAVCRGFAPVVLRGTSSLNAVSGRKVLLRRK
jgi:hypothetical protein